MVDLNAAPELLGCWVRPTYDVPLPPLGDCLTLGLVVHGALGGLTGNGGYFDMCGLRLPTGKVTLAGSLASDTAPRVLVATKQRGGEWRVWVGGVPQICAEVHDSWVPQVVATGTPVALVASAVAPDVNRLTNTLRELDERWQR